MSEAASKKVKCKICPHGCEIADGATGFCKARGNVGGKITCLNYGKVTSVALDPIEKKPLYRFYSGKKILSVGSFGCNMKCGFCQNHRISQYGENQTSYNFISPYTLAELAAEHINDSNIGVAYTYNEPLVGFEYVKDCAAAVRNKGLKNVLVTNGCILEEPLNELLPYIDAMNIDLKSFSAEFYKKHKGDLQTVKNTIQTAVKHCHVEITLLAVTGENTDEEEITAAAKWLAGLDKTIPLHISRFFPNYEYCEIKATDVDLVYRLAEKAREYLDYVYTGNC